jgi:hypothetical protein
MMAKEGGKGVATKRRARDGIEMAMRGEPCLSFKVAEDPPDVDVLSPVVITWPA